MISWVLLHFLQIPYKQRRLLSRVSRETLFPSGDFLVSALHVKKDFECVRSVSRETHDKLHVYAGLLTEWQRAINLVSAATLPMVWERHIWDSAQLADYIPHDGPA